ncbi:tRNA lysidine(34) synthetase TilS [Brassicibacter mesophilus]|uniref:tRNA lysidine(34) synthetase TilS n=1 Tax=Brassicibacter mesophilus TaxID=745119 RepID=UPI003D202093
MIKDKVIQTIKYHGLINSGDNVVIGVSGGPDSMALLSILNNVSIEIGFKIYVAHVNHCVRGIEADKDQEYVRSFCTRMNLPFYSKKIDMNAYAKERKLTSEEAGREIRYAFFNEIISKLQNGKIAVAHNKNDQAETLLMRILRGTGIDGLKGMEYKNGNIIRPLLDIERSEIEKYCDENCLDARIDRTNLEPIYGRNKIRLELIPYVEENFNHGIIDTLARTSRLMQADSEFLVRCAEKKFKNIVVEETINSIVLSIEKLIKEHHAIMTRVLRLSIEKINGSLKGIEEKHIIDIIDLAYESQTGKYITISNNIVARLSYGNLIIERGSKDKFTDFTYEINIGKITRIEELKSTLISGIHCISDIDTKYKSKYIKFFDYDKISDRMFVRNRKSGDRFTPLGMKGSKKLKDFFIDEKIPRHERDRIPLVEHKGSIIWVIGYRINEEYKITPSTKNVLVLEYSIDH